MVKKTVQIKAILQAQKECCKKLTSVINVFFDGHKKGSVKVFPLSIPTGWGKTRVTIRSILNTSCKSTVVLWPQNTSHVNEIWASNYNWLRLIKKDTPESNVFNLWAKVGGKPKADLQSLIESESLKEKEIDKIKRHMFFYVNDTFKKKEEKQKLKCLYKKPKFSSNLIFVIDEWHSKNILKEFKEKGLGQVAFWKNFLLGKGESFSELKVFILLVSATPVASTSHMDSVKGDENDEHYEESIKEAMSDFSKLVYGSDRDVARIQNIYKEPILKSVHKLELEKNKINNCTIGNKWNWAKEYVNFYKKSNAKETLSHLVYLKDQALFWQSTVKNWNDEKSLLSKISNYNKVSCKQKALVDFLSKNKMANKNNRRKFVIFCHHIAIAKALEKYLNFQNVLKVGSGKNKTDCAYYLSGEPKKRDKKFQSFVETDLTKLKDNPERICYLIVTDKHSQGVSFHKSMAWLIHYELSWNPIRIVQRFGRVWRIKKSGNAKSESLTLTKPVAFYVPYTYSSEEEQIHRLIRRWEILKTIQDVSDTHLNLLPIDYEIALGHRITPEP